MNAEQARALVDTGIQQLLDDPEQWRTWAQTMTRFHHYSPGNVLLIMQQRPDASVVAGYHAWQHLGRQVQKGEHGIAILAPIVRTVPSEDVRTPSQSPAPPPVKAVTGFKVATVFDIAQTQGKDLQIPQPKLLDSGDLEEVLRHLIPTIPVPVQFAPAAQLHGANGVWSPANQTITIAQDRHPDHQLKTLLHEWAHSAGVPDVAAAIDRHTGSEEIVAETTAFVMAGRMGLDTSQYTLPYVGHWAQGDPQKVLALTQAVSGRVQSLSTVLEQAAQKDPVLASVSGFPSTPSYQKQKLPREEYEAG
jgi:hypothetical protein